MLAIFAKMLEERPVQSLRRDVEALKIAFYKLRRAESDAARRAFVEAGGAEGDFVSEPDPAELRFKDLFREYRRLRDEFVAGLEATPRSNTDWLPRGIPASARRAQACFDSGVTSFG